MARSPLAFKGAKFKGPLSQRGKTRAPRTTARFRKFGRRSRGGVRGGGVFNLSFDQAKSYFFDVKDWTEILAGSSMIRMHGGG